MTTRSNGSASSAARASSRAITSLHVRAPLSAGRAGRPQGNLRRLRTFAPRVHIDAARRLRPARDGGDSLAPPTWPLPSRWPDRHTQSSSAARTSSGAPWWTSRCRSPSSTRAGAITRTRSSTSTPPTSWRAARSRSAGPLGAGAGSTRRAATRPSRDRCGGAEHAPARIERLDGDVLRHVHRQLDPSLEAAPLRALDGQEDTWVLAREHLPAIDVGRAVPAGDDVDATVARQRGHRRPSGGPCTMPGQPVGAVGLLLGPELRLEHHPAARRELRHVRLASAPADEGVAARQDLHAPLTAGEEGRAGVLVLVNERHRARGLVHAQGDAPGLPV